MNFLSVLLVLVTAVVAQSSASSPSSSFNTVSYYSSLKYDVVSFYANFLENKQSYIHDYQRYFISHTFTDINSKYATIIPHLTTYTDDSFTTELAGQPDIITVLASVAPQFPWYSDWVQKNAYVEPTQSANSAATDSARGDVAKRSMTVAVGVVAAMAVTFGASLI